MFVNLVNKKIAIYTLGCKVNQYESDSMMDILKQDGAVVVSFDEFADVYIINTCSVTNMAERKSRQIIHRAKKKNPNAVIAAAGCYVQAAREQLENDENIDILIGNNKKKEISKILDEYFGGNVENESVIEINEPCEYENMTLVKPSEHTRAYVKVQDGCNNFCTYCIIPFTRGRIRSRMIEDVLLEVNGLAQNGIKEVVITGINLSSYQDANETKLHELLKEICKIDGIERVRMGSLEPRVITEEFLDAIASEEKICPHFHLSLQSACNETLKRMNRKYTIEEYMEKCDLIRKYYDRPALTTDVIVGFPGETDEEFKITYDNLKKINLYEMHIFKYSKRNGTAAAKMKEHVTDKKKDERSSMLLELTAKQKKEYENSFSGEYDDILIEEYIEKNNIKYLKGHTKRYILVEENANKYSDVEKMINTIVNVKLP